MKCLCTLFFLTLAVSCTAPGPDKDIVFNVQELIAQSPEGVVQVLGKPDSTFQLNFFGKRYFVQYYRQYGIEVRHHQNRVSNIIVNEPYPLAFSPETITKFGIKYVEPTKYNPRSAITWKNVEGIKVINFYLRGVKKPDSIKHSYHIYFNMDTTKTISK